MLVKSYVGPGATFQGWHVLLGSTLHLGKGSGAY
jgi:hypothetical protein